MACTIDLTVEAGIANRAINPVVKAIAQVAGAGMGVANPEPGEQYLPEVGPVIPVGVLQEKKLRGMSQDDTTTRKSHGARDIEAVRKDGKLDQNSEYHKFVRKDVKLTITDFKRPRRR